MLLKHFKAVKLILMSHIQTASQFQIRRQQTNILFDRFPLNSLLRSSTKWICMFLKHNKKMQVPQLNESL